MHELCIFQYEISYSRYLLCVLLYVHPLSTTGLMLMTLVSKSVHKAVTIDILLCQYSCAQKFCSSYFQADVFMPVGIVA